jgi:hypothetical protein
MSSSKDFGSCLSGWVLDICYRSGVVWVSPSVIFLPIILWIGKWKSLCLIINDGGHVKQNIFRKTRKVLQNLQRAMALWISRWKLLCLIIDGRDQTNQSKDLDAAESLIYSVMTKGAILIKISTCSPIPNHVQEIWQVYSFASIGDSSYLTCSEAISPWRPTHCSPSGELLCRFSQCKSSYVDIYLLQWTSISTEHARHWSLFRCK